jgi:glutamine amidotransferase|tara:strand:+ start:1002 stop:1655 length:654 start_codon:yes stop_codon:yes gene_type:complete
MNLLTIIDYGCGNIRSVYNAFNLISKKKKLKIVISSNKSDIERSSHLVLPGVGSYETCINGLRNSNLIDSILKKVNIEKKPFLGICVGMQMLASKGFENGEFLGLNWIKGNVKKIKKSHELLKIPHMGWNNLLIKKENSFIKKLKEKIDKPSISAYFVHSYNFETEDSKNKIMTTNYGQEITAMVSKENIIGVQFHPEKSHKFGIKFLETFIENEEF